MLMRHASAMLALSCVLTFAAKVRAGSTGIDRVVGVNTADGGVSLVKSFVVGENTEIQGVDFLGNDLNTIFPRISLVQGPLLTLREGTQIFAKEGIRHENGRHHGSIRFNAIPVATVTTVYVVIELPPGTGASIVGSGAGIGAKAVDEPLGSFIAFDADTPLVPLYLDLAVDLVLKSRIGKAGSPGNGDAPAPSTRTFLAARTPSSVTAVAIEFGLQEVGIVDLSIYDVSGRRVRSLLRMQFPAGIHTQVWDGLDTNGRRVASGIYLAKLRAGDRVFTQKLVLAK